VLSGQIEAWYGEELAGVGDLFYIPAGVPHMPANLTDSPASAIIATLTRIAGECAAVAAS